MLELRCNLGPGSARAKKQLYTGSFPGMSIEHHRQCGSRARVGGPGPSKALSSSNSGYSAPGV